MPTSRILLVVLCLAAAVPLAPAGAQKKQAPARRPAAPRTAPPPQGPDLPSRLPANRAFLTVNGEQVPISEYVDRLSLRFAPQIREELLTEALIRQEAKRRKLTVTPAELDAEVKRAVQQSADHYGGEDKFAAQLKNSRGWSLADFRAVVRRQAAPLLLQQKIAGSLVKPEAVTDRQVEARYEEDRDAWREPDVVRISHILYRRPGDAAEEQDRRAKAKAEAALNRLKGAGPAEFAALARSESDDRITGADGGRIPTDILRGANPFGAGFDAAVFSTESGIVPEVVQTPLGYHVIRVDSRKPGRVIALSEAAPRIREVLLVEKRAAAWNDLMARLRATAKVETGRF